MNEYHKIDSLFKRDPADNFKTLLLGQYTNSAFEYLSRNEWEFTEKVDGTNIRVMIHPEGKITFGGKTDNAQMPTDLLQRLMEKFLPQKDALLTQFPDGGCLYGEGYGPGIQKGGGNYRKDKDFVLFDVLVGHWWLERNQLVDVATKLSLDLVPVVGYGDLEVLVAHVQEAPNSYWGPFKAEGVVARPKVELKARSGARIITKLKLRDFTP